MKEYQYQRDRGRILPRAVYHQCIWIIRDMERLRLLAEEGDPGEAGQPGCEEARLKLECIRRALGEIPEFYREELLRNIIQRGSGYNDWAHENTWKKWKQRFIYALAQHLSL